MLEALIKRFGAGNKTQFAKMLGVTPQAISTWLSRDTFDKDLIFAKCEHVVPKWLLTGEGPMVSEPVDELRDRLSYILLLIGTDNAPQYLGVNKYQLMDFCNGGILPSDEFDFNRLLKRFPFNPDWLIKGKGDMYISGTKEENEKAIRKQIDEEYIAQNNEIINAHLNQPTINEERKGSPYYSVDFIGGFDWVENDQTRNPDFYINYPPYNKDGVVWVNLTGHSMEPEISNGDIIALRLMETPIEHLPSGEIYAIITEDYRTVKRIRLSERPGFVWLIPSNKSEEFQKQEIPISIIRKVYAVLGSIRKFF